jgi:hypothetical protein
VAIRSAAIESALRLSPRIEILPIVHANGDMAQEVRETLISRAYDCLAVPLPESVSSAVEAAIDDLPTISVVVLREHQAGEDPGEGSVPGTESLSWQTQGEAGEIVDPGWAGDTASYVPIDPCQAVIMGLRVAMGEGIQRAYIDRDVNVYEPEPLPVPDPYSLKTVSVAAYGAAALPSLPRPVAGSQRAARIAWMAFRLHELELDYEAILALCPVQDWPYLREAYRERKAYEACDPPAVGAELYPVSEGSLYFILGELPFITGLYEQRRAELRSDRHLSIDGVKELLLETRLRCSGKGSVLGTKGLSRQTQGEAGENVDPGRAGEEGKGSVSADPGWAGKEGKGRVPGAGSLPWQAEDGRVEQRPGRAGDVASSGGWDSPSDWMTPQRLQIFLQYVRNLALLDRRLTPDLYTLVTAAKQIGGDQFAITLIETAKDYAPARAGFGGATEPGKGSVPADPGWAGGMAGGIFDSIAFGIGQAEFPDGTIARMKSRLPGPPQLWRTLQLKPKPSPIKRRDWGQRWNPLRQCSWPPEDSRIESFNLHVRDQAKALIGADLARTEKFTTSVKDGIDFRETLRQWHKREIYVKDIPPARGSIEIVVFLFDTPADAHKYSWQATWFAEHPGESTLSFFATPFSQNLVGPGVAQSLYGGAMFLFPPRPIPDIWTDPRLAFDTLEERLLAGALLHSQEQHVALVSPIQIPARWRLLARRFRKQLIPIPLSRFSRQTIHRLRHFHVLNGHEVRSYAAKFIQDM